MAVANIGPTHMPMATSMAMPAAMPTFQPTPTFDSTTGGLSQPSDAGSMLWEHGSGGSGEGVGIGIDLDCDRIRVSVWSAEDGKTVPLFSMPCRVKFASPTKALVGDDATAAAAEVLEDDTPVPLVGVQRLLGRSYASLAGAKWIEQEADDTIGAELIPAGAAAQASDEGDDGDAGVRLRLTFKRAAPSGLKKRGGASAGGDGKKPRSTTIERVLAPEEVLSKLLIAVKQRAEANVDAEVTHATVAVPAHWGLAQRRAAFDGCLLAGLTPLAIVSHPVALLAGGLFPRTTSPPLAPPTAAADGAPLLMIEWGAGSCSAAVFRRVKETFELAGVDGADGAGGLALDRLVAKKLARDLASRIACEGVDLTSRASRVELVAAAGRLREGLSVWRGEAASAGSTAAGTAAASTAETTVHLYDPSHVEVSAELTTAEWREAVESALPAVGSMVAELMARCGIEAGSKVAVHAGGVVAACAPARLLLERTLAPWRCALAWAADGDGDGDGVGGDGGGGGGGAGDGEDDVFARAGEVSEGGRRVGGGGSKGSHQAACGAARLAAHHLQREAVERAWLAEHSCEWVDVHDALPFAVACEGGGGARTQIFPPLTAPGCTEVLHFDAAGIEQGVQLIEDRGGGLGTTPLLRLTIPAMRRRGPLSRAPRAGEAQRSITVKLLPSGVLDADLESSDADGDGGRGSRLGVGGVLLLLLMLVGSVVSVMGRAPLVPPSAGGGIATGTSGEGAADAAAETAASGGSA